MKQASLAKFKETADRIKQHLPFVGGAAGAGIGNLRLSGRPLLPAGIHDSVIPIFDFEPTSIVAYFLSSRGYQMHLNTHMKRILAEARRGASGSGSGSGTGLLRQPSGLDSYAGKLPALSACLTTVTRL